MKCVVLYIGVAIYRICEFNALDIMCIYTHTHKIHWNYFIYTAEEQQQLHEELL